MESIGSETLESRIKIQNRVGENQQQPSILLNDSCAVNGLLLQSFPLPALPGRSRRPDAIFGTVILFLSPTTSASYAASSTGTEPSATPPLADSPPAVLQVKIKAPHSPPSRTRTHGVRRIV